MNLTFPQQTAPMVAGQLYDGDFAKGAKELLDLLVACKLSVADTAKALGLTTGKVSKLITSDNDLLTEVNRLRQKDGLKPLRK